MVFRFDQREGTLRVALTGWDRGMIWRRGVDFDRDNIARATVAERHELESLIDHRWLGFGTHDGAKRPGRRRVGLMMGRGMAGKQFWAVPRSGPELPVLVLGLLGHEFSRAVLAVSRPQRVAEMLTVPHGRPTPG